MFGFFDGDKEKVRKLRLQYEDIRQRVLYKMNGYEQFSFATGYISLFNEIDNSTKSIGVGLSAERKRLSNSLKLQAEEAWRSGQTGGDIHRESVRAGANALALHAIAVDATGYQIAEALTLTTDIGAFKKKIEQYLKERDSLMDMIPRD